MRLPIGELLRLIPFLARALLRLCQHLGDSIGQQMAAVVNILDMMMVQDDGYIFISETACSVDQVTACCSHAVVHLCVCSRLSFLACRLDEIRRQDARRPYALHVSPTLSLVQLLDGVAARCL